MLMIMITYTMYIFKVVSPEERPASSWQYKGVADDQ